MHFQVFLRYVLIHAKIASPFARIAIKTFQLMLLVNVEDGLIVHLRDVGNTKSLLNGTFVGFVGLGYAVSTYSPKQLSFCSNGDQQRLPPGHIYIKT